MPVFWLFVRFGNSSGACVLVICEDSETLRVPVFWLFVKISETLRVLVFWLFVDSETLRVPVFWLFVRFGNSSGASVLVIRKIRKLFGCPCSGY